MRAVVDHDLCAGHGNCVSTCPEAFRLTPGGYADASNDEIASDLVGLVRQAAHECPEGAIVIHTE